MDVAFESTETSLEQLEHEVLDIHTHEPCTRVETSLPDLCQERNIGLVVIPGVKPSWFDLFRPPRLVRLPAVVLEILCGIVLGQSVLQLQLGGEWLHSV